MLPNNQEPDDPRLSSKHLDGDREDWNAIELQHWIEQADRDGFLTEQFAACSEPTIGPTERIPEGTRIDGYQIGSVLGIGGRGVVYQAQQLSVADRKVAMKVYHEVGVDSEDSDINASDTKTSDIAPEILALASLSHPHLARIFDAGRTPDGRLYVVMSLLSGVAIDEYCLRNSLSPSQIAQLMSVACDAIHELHHNGFVHCDIKPSNIIVDENGVLTVTDFDAAQLIAGRDQTHRGTPGYLAPERFALSNQPLQHSPIAGVHADLFSLGVTLYVLLTGSVPFTGQSAAGQMISTLMDTPKHPRQLQPRIPIALDKICMRCLNRDPDQRYASAKELADSLREFSKQATDRSGSWIRDLVRHPVVGNRYTWFALTTALSSALIAIVAVALLNPFDLRPQGLNQSASTSGGIQSRDATLADSTLALWVSKSDGGVPHFLETRNPRPGFMYASISPDGRQIAAMGNDRWIRIYQHQSDSNSTEIGDLVAMLPMDRATDTLDRSISWSPDGSRIVACANDQCAILWDVSQKRRLSRLKNTGKYNFVRDVQWSPDGTVIASGSESGLVSIWNDQGVLVDQFDQHQAPVLKVRWSDDGNRIASADQSGRVLVWEARSHAVLLSQGNGESESSAIKTTLPTDAVRGLAWHPDGQRLATSNENGQVFITDCQTGVQDLIAETESPSHGLLWSPDGEILVIAGTELSIYSDREGFRQIDEPNDEGTFGSIQWDGARGRLLIAGRQLQLQSWDLELGQSQLVVDSNVSRVLDLEWSSDGQWLASAGSDGHARVFDAGGRVATAAALVAEQCVVLSIAWHPDRHWLACAYGYTSSGIKVFEIEHATSPDHQPEPLSLRLVHDLSLKLSPQSIAWDNHGEHLIVGDDHGQMRVFRISDWMEIDQTESLTRAVADLVVGRNDIVAAGDLNGQLKTWQLDRQGKLHPRHQRAFDSRIHSLAFDSSGGRLAVSEYRKHVFMLDSDSLSDLWQPPVAAPARPGKLAWSPDDRHLGCGVFGMLDARDGSLVDANACERGGCVAWHANGLIVTGSWEGELEFRSPPDYHRSARLLQFAGGTTVTLPPTGIPADLPATSAAELVWVAEPEPGRFELLP